MERCANCPGINTPIPPDGPMDAEILLIGEAAGKQEQNKGKVFIGQTGQELDRHYLPLAGLRRDNVLITNAISCLPPSTDGKLDPNLDRDVRLLQSCAECHLYPLINRVRPKLIVPMGNFACRAIDPDYNLELQHGMPTQSRFGPIFGMYHPAGGLHMPKAMLYIRTDWARLRKYLRGTYKRPVDEWEGFEDYRELTTPDEVDEILIAMWDKDMACDTENRKDGSPFCFTFSVEVGTGYLIRAENKECLDRMQYHLNRWRGRFLWHNWLHDYKITKRMGLTFRHSRVVDTMVVIFNLGSMAQGLKSFAWRELGCKMTDFDDVVRPHSTRRVLDYFIEMKMEDWPKPEPQVVIDSKTGLEKLYKPHGLTTKLKLFYTYLAKNPSKDVFEAWSNWEDEHEMVQERLGPFPGICISHAAEDDWPKVTKYACLHRSARVSTPTGHMRIGDMVMSKYSGLVDTYNPETDRIEQRRVTGHYRVRHSTPIRWIGVVTTRTRLGRWGYPGTRYTPDHKVLTPNGYVPIETLKKGDILFHPTEKLSSVELQVTYGSLLGDGGIKQRNLNGWASLAFSHNEKQWAYGEWKCHLLHNLHPKRTTLAAGTKTIEGKEANCLRHRQYNTRHHPELSDLRASSYIFKGRKNISDWILSIAPLAIAIWYQDDGTLVGNKAARFYTNGFTPDEVNTLSCVLRNKFGIESNLLKAPNRESQYFLSLPRVDSTRLFNLVAPFIHPSMEYKIPEEYRGAFVSPDSDTKMGLVESEVLDVIVITIPLGKQTGQYYSYCIDVEDTHNFLTMDEVAHNCRDSDVLLRAWPRLKRMQSRVRKTVVERWED